MSEVAEAEAGWRRRVAARVQDLLADARAARAAGDWKAARSLLDAVNALDPGNREAEALLAGGATRRQMTLLFCDIVGSTEIADSRDPEEVSSILEEYRATCAQVVEELDGYIDDHRGDGMLVLFGYPQVNEDDARRGVLCGLRMIERIKRLRPTGDPSARLHVRVAVHTDLVVVGDGIAGATANEAARIEQLAPPDTVLVSDTTQALVWPWFETESFGAHPLRGVSRPVEVYTVVRELPSRRGTTWVDRTSPFVNRADELAAMGWLTDQAPRTTGARAVLLSGPGGMGKTRFTRETARLLGLRLLDCSCSRMHRSASLHPFRSVLEEACDIVADDPPEVRLDKLRSRLAADGLASADLPFLAATFDIGYGLVRPPADVEPDQLRQQALRAAAALVHTRATAEPSLLFVDDVQWADQSALELLATLLEFGDLAIVIAAREGFELPWPSPMLRRIRLEPLGPAATAELVRLTPTAARLPPERSQELIERSDGVPLFLEELLHTAEQTESGQVPHRSLQYSAYKIPPALRDPLLARLSLPEVDLELAQFAAVVGRDVDRDLLRRAVGAEPQEFESRLRTLLDAGLIELQGAQVRFRHELIREVAYETQRRSVLRERHGIIANQLLALGADDNRAAAGEAAFHLERAERYDEAVAAHIRIAQADQALGAHAQAVQRLTEVLELLKKAEIAEGAERLELAVRELRSFSAVTANGYAAPEAAEDYPRCLQLVEESVRDTEVLPYLIRSWSFHLFRGDLDRAEIIHETTWRRALAAGSDFPAMDIGGGVLEFFRGDFRAARDSLLRFSKHPWGSTPGGPPAEWTLPNDPLVAVNAHLVPTLWILGERDASLDAAERGLQRASQLGYPHGPFSTLYVHALRALTRNIEQDFVGAAEIGRQIIELAERHGFALWRLTGQLQCLISAVHLGDSASLPQLVKAAAAWHVVVAADSWTPYWLTAVGLAQLDTDRPAEAIQTCDQALSVARATGSEFYSAETLRGRGEARLRLGLVEGEQDLAEARELAERQAARIFAHRARTSLAELARG